MRLALMDRGVKTDLLALEYRLNQDTPPQRAAMILTTLLVLLISLAWGASTSQAAEEDARLSVIKIVALRQGAVTFGSAVVVAPGKVITNCHVVRNAGEIKLISVGQTWPGRLAGHDVDRDLCVVVAPDLQLF